MKWIRVAYLAFVMVVACAHMFVAVSPWTALPFVAGGSGPVGMAWFVVVFGAWIIATMADVILNINGVLPLSFAGEAIVSNISLAILATVDGGLIYFLCAVVGPTLVLVKASEEILYHGTDLN